SQEQDYRPSLRSRPRARQQGQGERQDTTQNCRLEPGFPARNPSTQMTVNLDSVPWGIMGRYLTLLEKTFELFRLIRDQRAVCESMVQHPMPSAILRTPSVRP